MTWRRSAPPLRLHALSAYCLEHFTNDMKMQLVFHIEDKAPLFRLHRG